ncbi:hypothetical protein MesoLj113c_54530 [Mesorhizobium sp. 113-3-9]|nr:hypothetical protein MesoLj113c_54530 [Mesorhizobium sp. 113-3-9]
MRSRMIQPHLDEDERAAANLCRIEHRPDGSDEPVAEQSFHALAGTGRRQADAHCQIKRGATSIFLQQPQETAIDGVKSI